MKKYYLLHPAVFKLDGGAMFGIIPKPLWSRAIEPDDQNRIELSLRVMFIQTKNRNIIIDTGIGDYHGDKFDQRFGIIGETNPLVNLLKKEINISPEDITDLIISHLHFDHVGGLGESKANRFIFPNAKIHLHKKHFEYSLNPTPRDTGSFHTQYFKPLIEEKMKSGEVNWLEGETGTILEDDGDKIFFKCSHGHTPFLIHAYDDQFMYMADLVPTAHHIPVPWVMGYDIAPGQTTLDKMRFYEFISKNQLTMIFEHDMKNWGAKIDLNSNGDINTTNLCSVADPSSKLIQIFS